MSAELLHYEPMQHREVLVDSFDDLLLVKDGLTLLKTQVDDPAQAVHIQELRDVVIDDVIKTQEGELEPGGYVFDGAEEALIGTAKAVALQARQADEAKLAKPVHSSSRGSGRVATPVVRQRITSYDDPRLDEKPRRLFSR